MERGGMGAWLEVVTIVNFFFGEESFWPEMGDMPRASVFA